MTLIRRKRQEGSTSFAAVASIGALAMAILFTENSARKTNQVVKQSNVERLRQNSSISTSNAISRFKSMVHDRKHTDGTYGPSVFAADYYAPKWELVLKKNMPIDAAIHYSPRGKVGEINVFNQGQSQAKFTEILAGSTIRALPLADTIAVEVLFPNYETDPAQPGYQKLVKSIDLQFDTPVEVAGKDLPTKLSARIFMPAPKPFNSKVLFRKVGSTVDPRELVDGEDLSAGNFEFFIVTSGIAYNGALFVDGKEVTRTEGFGPDGKISHRAVNHDARDVPLSAGIPLKLAPSAPDQALGASSAGGIVDEGDSFNESACYYIPSAASASAGSGAGLGGGVSIDSSVTGMSKIQARVFGPDEVSSDESKVYNVRTSPPASAAGRLSLDDYRNKCSTEEQCVYLEGNDGTELWRAAATEKRTSDITSKFVFTEAQEAGGWGIFNKKVCFNFSKSAGAIAGDADIGDAIVVVYNPTTCTKKNLFQRKACGCLTGDTLITMGDGQTQKRIDQVEDHELIWNPMRKASVAIRKITMGPEKIPTILLTVDGKTVQATGSHPFRTRNGFVPAYQLKSGDEIMMADQAYRPVSDVKPVSLPLGQTPPNVWNIEVDANDDDQEAHHFIANGITTGDLMIQKKLQSGLLK